MAIILGVDTLLIRLELRNWMVSGIILTVMEWSGMGLISSLYPHPPPSILGYLFSFFSFLFRFEFKFLTHFHRTPFVLQIPTFEDAAKAFLQLSVGLSICVILQIFLVTHLVIYYIPAEVRVELRRQRLAPRLAQLFGPQRISRERPPWGDVLTKIVLEVGLLWIGWELEWIWVTLFGPSPRAEPFLRLFQKYADIYTKGCLLIDVSLTIYGLFKQLIGAQDT